MRANPQFKERTIPIRAPRRSSTTTPAVLSSNCCCSTAHSLRVRAESSNKCVSKGYRVNWRSYERQARPEPQYAAQAAAPARQAAHRRAPPPPPQQAPEPTPQYKHYANAPPQIQQLLQFQQQIPYINVIPEPYRWQTTRSLNERCISQMSTCVLLVCAHSATLPLEDLTDANVLFSSFLFIFTFVYFYSFIFVHMYVQNVTY